MAIAEQVALGDRHVADHAFTRRVAGTERKLARRLFCHLHVENDAVRRRTRASLDFDVLENAQPLQALLGAIDEHAVEGITFRKAEFAADHVILRAIVADDVDALDVNSRTFIDDIGNADRVGRRIRNRAWPNAREGVTLLSDRKRQRFRRLVDLGGIVNVAGVSQNFALIVLRQHIGQRTFHLHGTEIVKLSLIDRERDEEAALDPDRSRRWRP